MKRWLPLLFGLGGVAALALLTHHLVSGGLSESGSVLGRTGRLRLLSTEVAREVLAQDEATASMLLDPELIAEVSEAKIAAYDRQRAFMRELATLADDAQIREVLSQLEAIDERELKPIDERLLEGMAGGAVDEARATYREKYVPARAGYTKRIAQLAALADAKARDAEEALTAQTQRIAQLLLGVYAGAALLVLVVFMMNRSRRAALDTSSRMQRLVEVTRQVLKTDSAASLEATLTNELAVRVSLSTTPLDRAAFEPASARLPLAVGDQPFGALHVAAPLRSPEEQGFWASLAVTVSQHLASLEAKSAIETAARELATAEAQTRAVLESLSEGLVVLDLERRVQPLWSRAMSEVAPLEQGQSFERWLHPDDEPRRLYTEALFSQLAEDVFPFEASASSFPTHYERDGKTFALSLSPVRTAQGALSRIIVTLRDVTEETRLRRASLESRDLFQFLERAREQPDEASSFLSETKGDLTQLGTEVVVLKRRLHTVKGTAAIFGLEAFSAMVHEAESVVEEHGELSPDWRQRLLGRFEDLERRARGMLSETLGGQASIPREALDPLADMLERHGELVSAEYVRGLGLMPLTGKLEGLRRQAEATARRLNKRVEVTVDAEAVRVDPKRFTPFLRSLVHVVRNAVDHGIEATDARRAHGKDDVGHLRIEAHRKDAGTEFVVADDGAGIDFQRVAEKAKARGLPSATHDDMVAAIFSDGVSTRDEITDVSGRGVGLAAVWAECQVLGGSATVEVKGGTRFRFWFPDQPPALSLVKPLAAGV